MKKLKLNRKLQKKKLKMNALVVEDPLSESSTACALGAAREICKVVHSVDFGINATPKSAALEIKRLINDGAYSHLIFPDTSHGKNIAPMAAALMNAPIINGVIKVIASDTFEKSAHSGAIIKTLKVDASPIILGIIPHKFKESTCDEKIDLKDAPSDKTYKVLATNINSGVSLASADVVVAGGKALESSQNFQLIEDLAGALKGASGATRDAVDLGYAPNSCQIGQTGVSVAPSLYIGFGISGAVQHTCGMRESKVIIAINTDEDAPLCKMADYILNADLLEVLPPLTNALQN